MLSREEVKRIADKVISFSKARKNGVRLADEAEVIIISYTQSLTRYANNAITQNVHEDEITELMVRLIKSGKVARATTNKIDDTSLKNLVLATAEAIKYQKPDKKMLPLATKQSYRTRDNYSEKTASFGPHDRAEAIRLAVAECEKRGLNGSGTFSNTASSIAVANSKGVFAYHQETESEFALAVFTTDSSGWAREQHKDVRQIRPLAVTKIALDKALKSQNPVALPPGKYTVILEPPAVSEFLLFMALRGLGALAYLEERSFLSGKLGQKVMGDNITILDNVYHPQTMGAPFDFEGMPKKEVVLIEKGVAKNVVHDRETAQRLKTTTTGHALPQPNSFGPLPSNLVLMPGDSSLEEMISSTEKGILVTQLHYTNLVEPMQLVLTGMTRNGTFLIENGRISRGIKNMRFTESGLAAFSKVEEISRETKYQKTFFGGGFIVPALKIRDFNFSSETKF